MAKQVTTNDLNPALAPVEDKESAKLPTVTGLTTGSTPYVAGKPLKPGIVYSVPLSALHVEEGYNVRSFDPANDKIDEDMVRNVRILGVTTPLLVRMVGSRLLIVQGHRRFGAATAAGRDTVPVVLANESTPEQRLLDLYRSNNGRPLNMLSLALVAVRLSDLGMDDATIARNLGGYVARYVHNLRVLGSAPAHILQAVRENRLAGTEVYNTVQTFVAPLGKDVTDAQRDTATRAAHGAISEALKAYPKGKITAAKLKEFIDSAMGVKPADPLAVYKSDQRSILSPDGKAIGSGETTADAVEIVRMLNIALGAIRDKANKDKPAAADAPTVEAPAPAPTVDAPKPKRGRPAKVA